MRVRAGWAAVVAVLFPAVAGAETYVRVGAGFEASRHVGLSDADCSSVAPPAVFGCARAMDGEPLSARGHYGRGPLAEFGLGRRIAPYARLELTGTWRPDLDFRGRANFLRTPGPQPVRAQGSSLAVLATAYYDFGQYGRLRPFVGFGAGVARNRMGEVRYAFPGLPGGDAATVTPGGVRSSLAWSASAGLAWSLSDRAILDVSYRYTNLGEVRARPGEAQVVRAGGTRQIVVAATRAKLEVEGVAASVRWAF